MIFLDHSYIVYILQNNHIQIEHVRLLNSSKTLYKNNCIFVKVPQVSMSNKSLTDLSLKYSKRYLKLELCATVILS